MDLLSNIKKEPEGERKSLKKSVIVALDIFEEPSGAKKKQREQHTYAMEINTDIEYRSQFRVGSYQKFQHPVNWFHLPGAGHSRWRGGGSDAQLYTRIAVHRSVPQIQYASQARNGQHATGTLQRQHSPIPDTFQHARRSRRQQAVHRWANKWRKRQTFI